KVAALLKVSKANLLGTVEVKNQVNLKGQIDRILDELGEVPADIKAIKLRIESDFDSLIFNLESEIKKLDFKKKTAELTNKIKKNNEMLEPYLKKIAGQKELQKLTAQLESEKLKYQNAISLEKQLKSLLDEYTNFRKQTGTLLKKRFELYNLIAQKVNETKKNIGSDIELKCSLIYNLNNFALYEQANKASISSDHFFNSLFTENLVKYDLIPDFYQMPLRVYEDKLFYSKDENIPLKIRTTIEDVLRGLVKDSFEIDYTVTYKGDNLLKMSPGKKGTVLLILFLQISSSEFPILIDQPEDNLDNRTIYELLCKIIKEKKKDRQIIIVSHNANLVVATDTENIIVANQQGQEFEIELGRYLFEYVNGSLEYSISKDRGIKPVLLSQGIREHVCDILEGGGEAFKQRERKYSIK
ncbi:MAG: zinc ribbon domain-containing protein, partial [Ignavibacteriaceae bacterium]